MPKVFNDYAKIYDVIYSSKDYGKECLYLDKIFKKYASFPVKNILDVACGTGNHAFKLAGMGFKVFGQDISKVMLKQAKLKCAAHPQIKIIGCFAMQKFCHTQKFDACVAMFSSVDYLLKINQLKKAFKNIYNCLKQGGVFTFDFWNKDCVIKNFSPFKQNTFICGDKKVIRISQAELDKRSSLLINYTCYYFVKEKLEAVIKEKHQMRYHQVSSMVELVESCGFEVKGVFPFMKIGKPVNSSEWNISIVACKNML